MSVGANFAGIYLQGMRDRSMRSGTELAREIGQQQENNANWFLWFRLSHHWRNLFLFSQREKIVFSIVQITDQFKSFTLRFLSRQNVENKIVLTNNFFGNFNPIRRLRVARKP